VSNRHADKFVDNLKKINPWHFIWISLVLSEVFTTVMNVTMSFMLWGHIDYDLLFIGSVDALIVSLIVSSIVIYFLKYTARIAEANERLKREIAERKQIEEALENSEKRLKILFDYAPDATFLLDLKGTILDVNFAAEKMIGYTKEEIVGKNIIEEKLIPLSQVPRAIGNLAKGAMGSPIGPEEYTILRRDGTQVEVELSGYPVKIDNRVQVLCVSRDITMRKSLEGKLHDGNHRWLYRPYPKDSLLAVQHMKLANRNKRGIFMLYADLDGLKMININSVTKQGTWH
jgi:PAS domain S-box-containing protein